MGTLTEAGASYVAAVQRRLADGGYETNAGPAYQDRTFALAARRGGVEATKMGVAQYYFVLDEFPALDAAGLDAFGAAAYSFSTKEGSQRSSMPRGMGRSIYVFAVAILPAVDPALGRLVETRAGTKHFASAELRVLVDLGARNVYYLRKTPLWGAAYYRGLRKTIVGTLGF